MARRREARGQIEMAFRTHGGRRRGAGRRPKGARAGASHRVRPEHDARHPVHVTIRVVGSAPGMRCKDMYMAVRQATSVAAQREDFRIVHMSIQRDHLHLIVEADDTGALSRGVRGFSISAARQINRAFTARGGDGRTGRVIAERFHARPLTSPRAVRDALRYLFGNWRKHGEDRVGVARSWRVDPYSTGALFGGWKELEGRARWELPAGYLPLFVLTPRTWLLQRWDRFHPPISVREVPGHR